MTRIFTEAKLFFTSLGWHDLIVHGNFSKELANLLFSFFFLNDENYYSFYDYDDDEAFSQI